VPADLAGETVAVTLDGATYAAAITGDTWSVAVAPAALASLANGNYTVKAGITDSAGNNASSTDKLTVDETATLSIDPIDIRLINGANLPAAGGIGGGTFFTDSPASSGQSTEPAAQVALLQQYMAASFSASLGGSAASGNAFIPENRHETLVAHPG
jgi:hypothetical protein